MDQKQSHLAEKETATLDLHLHPLVIINISDHWTRSKVQNNIENPRVIGALVGTQSGRTVEIYNSYELVYSVVDGLAVIDPKYLVQKTEQFRKVFPQYDFLGWYSTGDSVKVSDLEIQKQIIEVNESPLFLLLDTVACARPDTKDLPITILESELRMVQDQPTMVFVKVPYRIETGEAERISVDHVARITPTGGSSGSQISAHLMGVHNSISMLSIRIRILIKFLEAVKAGKIPKDHGLLRQIGSLCAQLPSSETPEFKQDFIAEYNDSLMLTYLASITKGSHVINDMVDKFNLAYDKSSKRRNFI